MYFGIFEHFLKVNSDNSAETQFLSCHILMLCLAPVSLHRLYIIPKHLDLTMWKWVSTIVWNPRLPFNTRLFPAQYLLHNCSKYCSTLLPLIIYHLNLLVFCHFPCASSVCAGGIRTTLWALWPQRRSNTHHINLLPAALRKQMMEQHCVTVNVNVGTST